MRYRGLDYYRKRKFVLVSGTEGAKKEEDLIAREYDNVLMTLDDAYYYDENMRLRVREKEEESLRKKWGVVYPMD